jgi:hypothetical protein
VPFILRKIRKAKWYRSEAVTWLAEGDLQADALVDLSTKGNRLSVYLIDDDLTNLGLIVAALAANCDFISDFDYALLPQGALSELNIRFEKLPGDTPDAEVNRCHLDLIELTSSKIFALANTIGTSSERKRILSKRVLELVVQSVVSGRIEYTNLKLKPDQLAKVEALVVQQTGSS